MKSRLWVLVCLLVLSAGMTLGLAPAGAPERDAHALGRQALEHLQRNDFASAERLLREALEIQPNHPITLYNLACVLSLQSRVDDAAVFLNRAVGAGFLDFAKIERDTDLDPIRSTGLYKQLMASKDAILRASAEARIDALKEQFGDGYLYDISEADRLIFATNTDAKTLAALKKQLTDQARSQRRQLFVNPPTQYIAVILPSPGDYKRLVPNPQIRGFYKPYERVLIASNLGQTMVHEFTHALHGADLEALEQEHPIWLMEGMASLFEAGRLEDGELRPAESQRLAIVQHAARRNGLVPLDKLVAMEQKEFMSHGALAYGQTGSLLLYIHERGLTRRFYETVKETIGQDRTGTLALERTLGRRLPQIDADWRAWMSNRTPPARHTGAHGPFLGIAFGEGHDGLVVADLVPGGPAKVAGVEVGDVVVGIAAQDVRDYPSLVAILSEYEPGDMVTISVRRDGRYIDVDVPLERRSAVIRSGH